MYHIHAEATVTLHVKSQFPKMLLEDITTNKIPSHKHVTYLGKDGSQISNNSMTASTFKWAILAIYDHYETYS
jgi:hypothetical protein